MSGSGSESIRLHCICGQKMKISKSMYGLPGKCTSCRQKVRLPREDELPSDGSDIYLDEHPEFLRKSSKEKSGAVEPGNVRRNPVKDETPTPVTELDRSDSAEASQLQMTGSVPLDPLPSMQILSSLQLRLERKIQILDGSKTPDTKQRMEFSSRLKRVQGMRKNLDEQIHQALMEVAIKLTTTHENIADLQLGARVDEMPFSNFLDEVSDLRVRRDHLERQQLNLRGWLATVGPSAVGGYRDVTIDELPKEGYALEVSIEPGPVDSLLYAHADELRQAFINGEEADQNLASIQKQRKSADPEKRARLKDPYAHAKASKAIAEMQQGHFRLRLSLLIQDCEGDLETLDAQVATARDKLSIEQIERSDYDFLKNYATRTKSAIKKECDVARGLVLAKSPADVIVPQEMSANRKTPSKTTPVSKIKTATVVLWVIVLLLVLITLLPLSWKLPFLKAISGSGEEVSPAPKVMPGIEIKPIEPEVKVEEPVVPTKREVVAVTPVVIVSEITEPETIDTEMAAEPETEPEVEAVPLSTVHLKGVMTGVSGEARFSIEVVVDPAKPGITFRLGLEEIFLDGWVLSEYNSRRGYLLLVRKQEELKLYRGEVVPLPEMPLPPGEE